MFGIDRVKLKNIAIEEIDIDKLEREGFSVIRNKPENYRLFKDTNTGEPVGINYIKVSKQQDNKLRINELKVGRGVIPELNVLPEVNYEHLDVNLPNQISKQGINDNNISCLVELKESLRLIEMELEYLGFGKVDLMKSELKEIELNINILIDKDFQEYENAMSYLFSLLPRTIKEQRIHRKNGKWTGIVAENTQQQIKVYDKRQQIKDKTSIDTSNILRIEYTFKNESKIKNILGVKTLEDIASDNFKQVQRAMQELLYKDFISEAYKDIEKKRKHARRHLKDYKKSGGATAGQEYIYDYKVFDIEVVLEGIKSLDKSNNFTRDARKEIKRAAAGKQIELFGNLNKLNEILEKVGYQKIEIELTKAIENELEKYY